MKTAEPRRKIIAVDFDGVIAEYDGWTDGAPGKVRSDVRQAIQVLRSEGWLIIIHSCRSEQLLQQYLLQNDIPFDAINPGSPYAETGGKPLATVYWDDRACRYSGDALADLEVIRNFRTWSGRE